MATVTVRTPSEEVVQKATEVFYAQDGRGRRIGLKKPGVLAQFRLVDLLGETAKNEVYMGMILPLIWVCSIEENGTVEEVLFPATRSELDALIQRIDEDGIIAIATELNKAAGEAVAEVASSLGITPESNDPAATAEFKRQLGNE